MAVQHAYNVHKAADFRTIEVRVLSSLGEYLLMEGTQAFNLGNWSSILHTPAILIPHSSMDTERNATDVEAAGSSPAEGAWIFG